MTLLLDLINGIPDALRMSWPFTRLIMALANRYDLSVYEDWSVSP